MALHPESLEPISAIDRAIAVLNEALAADPAAMAALMTMETSCNEAMADHPSIQVGAYERETGTPTLAGPYWVRPLGLINGLFGVDADRWGFIAMNVDEHGRITEFLRTPPRQPDAH